LTDAHPWRAVGYSVFGSYFVRSLSSSAGSTRTSEPSGTNDTAGVERAHALKAASERRRIVEPVREGLDARLQWVRAVLEHPRRATSAAGPSGLGRALSPAAHAAAASAAHEPLLEALQVVAMAFG
jgi:hypothetical protein